jgi:hypothetical protein
MERDAARVTLLERQVLTSVGLSAARDRADARARVRGEGAARGRGKLTGGVDRSATMGGEGVRW